MSLRQLHRRVKLLFDENLSPRLVGELASHWPDSKHIEHLGMRKADRTASKWVPKKVHSFRMTVVFMARPFGSPDGGWPPRQGAGRRL
jgi:hypothetical protein